jgi:hypothetical protein
MRLRAGLALCLVWVACASEEPPAQTLRPFPLGVLKAFALASAPPADGDKGGSGRGRGRAAEAVAYVDGEPRGVLRFLELPPTLPVRWKTLEDGRKVRRYRVAEYVEALGVRLEDVNAVQLHGGRNRVSVVTGDDLRKHRETLLFSFTQGESGKPRMHYPDVDVMPVNTFIDLVYNLAIYAKKPAPTWDQGQRALLLADGSKVSGMPYVEGEKPGGTRVYVDSQLRAWIKRKLLPDKLVTADGDDETRRFSLRGFLEQSGVSMGSVRRLVLLADDEVLATYEGPKAVPESLDFTMPRHSKGQILMTVGPEPTRVSAVLVTVGGMDSK